MNIYITPKDIREGVPEHAEKCAVARALKRAFLRTHPEFWPSEVSVFVGSNATIRVFSKRDKFLVTGYHRFQLSDAVREWIFDFDLGLEVKPATFTVNPAPSMTVTNGAIE